MELKTGLSDMKKISVTAACFMGLSHLLYLKDYVKGAFFALCEVLFIVFIPFIFKKLAGLVTLGSHHPELPVKMRDNSVFMLIDGILILAVIAAFVIIYWLSVQSAKKGYSEYCRTGRFKSQKDLFETTMGKSFPIFGLAPAFVMIIVFVVVPLVFSVAVAFTNYSDPSHIPPNNTVDWVGFQNFVDLLAGQNSWSQGFARVAVWTLVWAVLSTFTCYFGGLLVAVFLKEINFHIAPFFRFIFILPYAVPSVVSMLVWKNLLNGSFGIVNRTLMQIGFISEPIPWLGNPLMAQFTCVVVNLWAGFGYFMLLSMGTMTAISEDMNEAAKIDGANRRQIFSKITLPLVLYQTLPLIIMSFAHNVNNFGAIYFLTNGAPTVSDSTTTMAGGTDILVTWIYKLTVTLMRYNYASVIAVMIFIVLAPFAIWQFKQTKAYKEGSL
ncbi:carbohydrate ABC transporter permease [Treponema sp.]|uniref:carbohydrate ABC transporter permease n=1 Tax=Treponema sp. TaxID=166 RepID=UPI00388F7DB9